MSDETKTDNPELDFVTFEPPTPETTEQAEESEYEAWQRQRDVQLAKERIETERSRFKGLQNGEVSVDSISDEFRDKLSAWAENRYKAIIDEFADRPWQGTERLDFFVDFYNKHPEIGLFLQDLEKRSPTEYKAWCDKENPGSRLARIRWASERTVSEMKRQNDPAHQKQVADLAKARSIKDGMHNDPDFYLIRDTLFKNNMPSNELNTLMVSGPEGKKQAYRLTHKAVAWGYCDPQSQLAKAAQRFVESESPQSADETWSKLLGNKPSPEDEVRCRALFGPNGAALSMQLLRTNKPEYDRMMTIAGDLGIIAKKISKEEQHMMQFRFHK